MNLEAWWLRKSTLYGAHVPLRVQLWREALATFLWMRRSARVLGRRWWPWQYLTRPVRAILKHWRASNLC